jgi:CRISPR/Cas system Type II protein with McrA/HNH and RuvC-like nuclease domain
VQIHSSSPKKFVGIGSFLPPYLAIKGEIKMATFYQNSDLFYKYKVKIKSGEYNESDIVRVEFTLGEVQKVYPSSDVEKVDDGIYSIRFSQEETLKLAEGVVSTQARIMFSSGNIVPTNIVYAQVKKTLSEKVLENDGQF